MTSFDIVFALNFYHKAKEIFGIFSYKTLHFLNGSLHQSTFPWLQTQTRRTVEDGEEGGGGGADN